MLADLCAQLTRSRSNSAQIQWERRFENWPFLCPSFSVDGVDCLVQNVGDARRLVRPTGNGGPNGSGAFISHKTNHAALRYFVCMNVREPIIVAAGGGYPAGAFVDLTIARRDIVPAMSPAERALADGGYYDFRTFMPPLRVNARARQLVDQLTLDAYHEAMQAVRARQEHINADIKEWAILAEVYRGDIHFHPVIFLAVVQLTQLRLTLRPSMISAPKYAPVAVDNNIHVLTFNKDGTVAGSCQL